MTYRVKLAMVQMLLSLPGDQGCWNGRVGGAYETRCGGRCFPKYAVTVDLNSTVNEPEIEILQIQIRMKRSWLEKTSIPDRARSIGSLREIYLQENGPYPSLNSWEMHVDGHELMLRSPT
ncbi:unnamed protein product [Penicillium camemberti]|uniref:Str. FM013 n=1 Tax=Penicillium camemberti (strain FM 013) TaxID=1429867 RepID=A0A0G4PC53_PENC3|nr:unnamed protein product [Penicillium camemberti]